PLVVFSGVMFFGRLYVDAVTDPCVGYWSDHFRGRFGRRKPFMLAGAIPTVISMVVLFLMPDMGVVVNSVVMTIATCVFFVGSTLCAMPYLAMLPEIAPHPDDRKQVASFLAIAVVFGVALGQVLPGQLPSQTNLGFMVLGQLQLAALLMAVVGTLAFFVLIVVFREPEWSDPDWRPDIKDAIESKVRHRNQPGMGLRQGLTLVGHTMLFGLLTYLWLAIVVPVWLADRLLLGPVRSLSGARNLRIPVRWVPFTPPAPLAPLGSALTTMARFKPFLGFAAAFGALHTAFVVITVAIPFVQQTMLGGNEAQYWVEQATAGDNPVLADASRIAQVTRELDARRAALGGVGQIDGPEFGRELVDAGVITDEENSLVLGRLNDKGNGVASKLLGFALGATLLIGVPLVYRMLGVIGHRRTGSVCLWMFIVAPLGMPVALLVGPVAGYWVMVGICLAVGIALAGIFVLDNLLLSDVIDLDTKMTGDRRESQYFGIYGLIMKIGIGLGWYVAAGVFTAFGYSLANPWGVALAGPVSSLIVLAGSVIYWRYFPDHMEREHPDPRHLYVGDPMKAPGFAEAHSGDDHAMPAHGVKFIVFEGADGVGKTTHADRVAGWLRAEGHTVVRLHEPTDGEWGQKIRRAAREGTRPDDAREEVRWFTEDRKHDVADNILPALAAGSFVVLDRYFYSTAAYQGARGVPVDEILAANRAFAPEPHLCVVLACDPTEARQRIGQRGDTPDAFEALDYQQRVAGMFDEIAHGMERDGVCPVLRVDTSGPLDEVAAVIAAGVRERL
ncbi:MAG: dTMP kinase, partial [Planctomycetota bacterium]